MELRVLGPIEAYESGVPTDLGGPKPRTVLALLVASLGRPVSADGLIEGVYGEAPPVRARRTIQTYVSSLRRVLGDVIRAEGHGYVLAIPETQVDACRFEAAVCAAEGIDPVARLEILDEVLPLWRGPYADVDGFGLLDPEITRLTELRIRALEDRAETALQLGRHRQLVEELEALVLENPLSESFRAQLMLALYRSGRQAEALRVAADARTFFGRELGLDPPPLVRVLEQQVIDQDPALDYRPRPRRAGLPARYSRSSAVRRCSRPLSTPSSAGVSFSSPELAAWGRRGWR